MPTYVYECPNCKRTREIQCSMDERDLEVQVCQDCMPPNGGLWKMKRIVAPTSFILKGPGWAKDGYSK
jgi:predicted nucleic acid-binding Zn ribbon protein